MPLLIDFVQDNHFDFSIADSAEELQHIILDFGNLCQLFREGRFLELLDNKPDWDENSSKTIQLALMVMLSIQGSRGVWHLHTQYPKEEVLESLREFSEEEYMQRLFKETFEFLDEIQGFDKFFAEQTEDKYRDEFYRVIFEIYERSIQSIIKQYMEKKASKLGHWGSNRELFK